MENRSKEQTPKNLLNSKSFISQKSETDIK